MMDKTTNPLNPLIPLNPTVTRDLVPLAVAVVGLAIMLGTAIMMAFLLVNRSMVQDLPLTPDARPDVYQPAATLLMVGVMCTLTIPMLIAWVLLSPIEVTYRRFGFAMVSGLGALAMSVLAVPANEFLGVRGLAGVLALALIASLLLSRKVRAERAAA